jgi:dipeptidyl aminopeptidase
VFLAIWAPTSDAVAFVVDNNVEIRQLSDDKATIKVTTDGSKDLFNGIPDWVYEEEVFADNKALWWSEDGQHLAFLRTNETNVPEYPLQYFASRPSGESPSEELENYPELDFIKYPKAGAPNPVVNLQFFDLGKEEVFSVDIENGSADDDRLITEVIWAGDEQVLIRETNRESDVLKMILINVKRRSGRVVRELDVFKLDGGWFEVVCFRSPGDCQFTDSARPITPPTSQPIPARIENTLVISILLFMKDTITLLTFRLWMQPNPRF